MNLGCILIKGEEKVEAVSEASSLFNIESERLCSCSVCSSNNDTSIFTMNIVVGQERFGAVEGREEAVSVGVEQPDGVSDNSSVKVATERRCIEERYVVSNGLEVGLIGISEEDHVVD